jgi:hypothetical protein
MKKVFIGAALLAVAACSSTTEPRHMAPTGIAKAQEGDPCTDGHRSGYLVTAGDKLVCEF